MKKQINGNSIEVKKEYYNSKVGAGDGAAPWKIGTKVKLAKFWVYINGEKAYPTQAFNARLFNINAPAFMDQFWGEMKTMMQECTYNGPKIKI